MSQIEPTIKLEGISCEQAQALLRQMYVEDKNQVDITLPHYLFLHFLSSMSFNGYFPGISALVVSKINDVFAAFDIKTPTITLRELAVIEGTKPENIIAGLPHGIGIANNKAVMAELEKPENHYALKQLAIAAQKLGSNALDEVLKKPEHIEIRANVFALKIKETEINSQEFGYLMHSRDFKELIPYMVKNSDHGAFKAVMEKFRGLLRFESGGYDPSTAKSFLENPNFDNLILAANAEDLNPYFSGFLNGLSGTLRQFRISNEDNLSVPYPAETNAIFELLKQNPVLVRVINADSSLKEIYDDIQYQFDLKEYYGYHQQLTRVFFDNNVEGLKEQFNSPEFTAIVDKILSTTNKMTLNLASNTGAFLTASLFQTPTNPALTFLDAFVPSENFERIVATGGMDEKLGEYIKNCSKILQAKTQDRDDFWNNSIKPALTKLLSSPAVIARVEANPDLKEEITKKAGFKEILEEALAKREPAPAIEATDDKPKVHEPEKVKAK